MIGKHTRRNEGGYGIPCQDGDWVILRVGLGIIRTEGHSGLLMIRDGGKEIMPSRSGRSLWAE